MRSTLVFCLLFFSVFASAQKNGGGALEIDTTLVDPKITLYHEVYRSYSTKGSSVTRVLCFYLNDKSGTGYEVGRKNANINLFLKKDSEAYKYSVKSRKSFLASRFIGIGAVGMGILTGVQFANDGDYGGIFLLSTLVTLSTCYTFEIVSKTQMKKAVKTYNRNRGYGYLCGLERKKK